MHCPKCKSLNTKVVDSRAVENKNVTRRRRQCTDCFVRFTTFEKIEITDLQIIKSNGNRELYDREKLKRGIVLSCGKLDITNEDIENMIQNLEETWVAENEISSKKIGQDIMDALRNLNQIAYIRFASVYRDFKDVEDFKDVLGKFLEK